MNDQAVTEIARLAQEAAGKVVEIEGKEYSTVRLYDPRGEEPEPHTIHLSTLQSFADFIKMDILAHDGYEGCPFTNPKEMFVHVVSPDQVCLMTGIYGDHNQRTTVVKADAIIPDLDLGVFMSQERFIVHLLTRFEENPGRQEVFTVAGNLANEAAVHVQDDGVSQVVETKAGVVRRGQAQVPCPVTLVPFRSFPEIEQVPIPFIFRIRGHGEGDEPRMALMECDGGLWRLAAVDRIKIWLEGELEGQVAIYA